MDEFSHLGVGNSRGSFIYLSSSSSAATGTTMASPTPPPSSATYGLNFYPAAQLQNPSPPTFKDEAGSSQYHSQKHGEMSQGEVESIKAKIISHPQYSSLLGAYMDCQKVGAPPEVIARLSAIARDLEACPGCPKEASTDPELDQFMDAYCNLLVKYREELARPLQEATDFLKHAESQFNALTNGAWARFFSTDEKCEGVGLSEEDQVVSGGEAELLEIDPRADDKDLKRHLLKKYSGYLSSLRQELSKKKKKGKLPKEARQRLLNWWELHYNWPYPSETEKVALAESTGLDPKQINNWFINQRKRHWKPSEDMQFDVMDGFHPHNASAPALFMEGQFMGDGMYRLDP